MQEGRDDLTGDEPFMVGIAPNYWSHVPLHIADVKKLDLIHGLNCWSTQNKSTKKICHVPISRCQLLGCVVSAGMRSDGSFAYVLDDGTGFMDCLVWSDEQGMYTLPSLFPGEQQNPPIQLGDIVRVFGKIQCVSVQREEVGETVHREIVAGLIEHIDDMPAQDAEAHHWQKCSSLQKDLTTDPTQFNALGFLNLLGPEIETQVRERQHFPSAGDDVGAWRVFGVSCRCTVGYKDALLYCHCQAKEEPLDPEFAFRDYLLDHLLHLESKCAKKLVFTYHDVKNDPKVRSFAETKVLGSSANAKSLVDRLVLNTFRALRNDGIIFLQNEKRDQYLFITRHKVLEPFLQFSKARNVTGENKNIIDFESAPFVSKVHHERLRFLQRCKKR